MTRSSLSQALDTILKIAGSVHSEVAGTAQLSYKMCCILHSHSEQGGIVCLAVDLTTLPEVDGQAMVSHLVITA